MYSQIISAQSLYAVMTQKEHRNYCHGLDKDKLLNEIQRICVDRVYDGGYRFCFTVQGGMCTNALPSGSIERLCQDLLIRKMSINILRSYRLKPSNRNLVIRQIKQYLDSQIPLCIMRKDVHHFFETINPQDVLLKLSRDGRVALQTIQLSQMLLNEAASKGVLGMPRGLAISSSLTEFLMHRFDYTFTKVPGVLFYKRYVDDIIIIGTDSCNMNYVQELVNSSLAALNLEENKDKRYSLTGEDWLSGRDFEYLGYNFSYNKRLKVRIAEKKLNKIKTRITLAFKDFVKTGDERMLFDRIQFLACASYIQSSSLYKIKIGVPINYSAVTNSDSFKAIDKYYQNVLHCKNGLFGRELQAKLTSVYRIKLSKISFAHCYEYHIKRKFSVAQMNKIKNCWR